MPDVGDTRTESLTVPGGDLTTVATIEVYRPNGSQVTPELTPTSADDGVTWLVDVDYDVTGWWLLTWTVTGAGAGVEHQRVFVDPEPAPGGPPIYATLEQLKRYMQIPAEDELSNADAQSALQDVSREIDSHCDRRFWRDDTATARTFRGGSTILFLDDLWSTDGLVIDGAAWPISGVTLLPRNGVVGGVEGWPYTKAQASLPWSSDVTVTAKWGWAAVPAPIHQACLILAAETLKLGETPFGMGGYAEFGIIRARDNPFAARKLAPYVRHPAVAL